MIAYRLALGGVIDTQTGEHIAPQDAAWQVYHAWLDLGNVPGPMPAAPQPGPPQPDFVALGKAMDQRAIARIANTDPLTAALMAGGFTDVYPTRR